MQVQNATRDELRAILGEPHDVSVPRKKRKHSDIWKYGTIEFHFDDDGQGYGKVFLIYTEIGEPGVDQEPVILWKR